MSYWEITIPEILDDIGITATEDQIKQLITSISFCESVRGDYASAALYEKYSKVSTTNKPSGKGYTLEKHINEKLKA